MAENESVIQKLSVSCTKKYLCLSFLYRTKDKRRFIKSLRKPPEYPEKLSLSHLPKLEREIDEVPN